MRESSSSSSNLHRTNNLPRLCGCVGRVVYGVAVSGEVLDFTGRRIVREAGVDGGEVAGVGEGEREGRGRAWWMSLVDIVCWEYVCMGS